MLDDEWLQSLTPPAWMRDALCVEYRDLIWFPERGTSPSRDVVDVCARCLVRSECLDYAIEHKIDAGIWAGLSPRARRDIARERAGRRPIVRAT